MEASAVLQQQASQTAPGPQGQQPTVANQVMQQAQQAAQPTQMPQMQAIGKQVGIAGQLMAQRQQQQQQAAQSPEAIAQMAAQMLQQKGVAALPTNMQFREGGIIGYAGPDGSVVTNPIPDRELAPMDESLSAKAQREMAEMDSGQRVSLSPDVERFLASDVSGRQQRAAAFAQRERAKMLTAGRGIAQRYSPPRAFVETMPAEVYSEGRPTPSPPPFVETMPSEVYSDGRPIPKAPTPEPSPAASASMDASDASIGAAGSSGIAAALPAALSVAKPDYQKILSETPESPESIARRQEKDKLRRERLGIAQAQEDLSARGIEALGRAKKDREQLLESARSRDTYERLNALFTSMRTLGNEVGNTQRAIQAREEAVVSANLLHEEAVLKLKQAQQARQLGLKDQEIQLIEAAEADEKKAQELRRADAKIKAELAKSTYEAESREMTHARDRANATSLRLADLKQQAQKAEDDRETRRLIGLQARLTSAQDSLTRAKAQVDQQVKNSEAYKAIEPIEKMVAMGAKPTPEQEKKLADFRAGRERLEAQTLQRFYAQLDAISKELGLESPVQAPATRTYDSSGKFIK